MQKLHAMYLELLQCGLGRIEFMNPIAITGVSKQKVRNIVDSCEPLRLQETANEALSAERT